MCHYTHLMPIEYGKVLFVLAGGKSITKTAHLLKLSKDTVSRKLCLNAVSTDQSMPYCPCNTQALYE